MKTSAKALIILLVGSAVAATIVLKEPTQDSVNASNTEMPVAMEASIVAPSTIASEKLPRLLDLGSTKCIPCRMMAPLLEELKSEYAGKVKVDFIDVWENPDEAEHYGIKIIPTQIFYDSDGNELFRHTGFYGKEDIIAKWKELGIDA